MEPYNGENADHCGDYPSGTPEPVSIVVPGRNAAVLSRRLTACRWNVPRLAEVKNHVPGDIEQVPAGCPELLC
jgi:hypothetical protein